jgi:TolB protein
MSKEKMKRFFILPGFFLALLGCTATQTPQATPLLVYITATPRVVEITTTPAPPQEGSTPQSIDGGATATTEPTTILPSPTSEPARDRVSFIDSGQRMGSARSWDVSLGDLDGDGDLDAFVANDSESNVGNTVWLNDAQGIFIRSEQNLGYGKGVELGDLDGDGDLDALITDWDSPAGVWLNSGSGVFTDSGQNLADDCMGAGLGDLDGDGDLDIYFGQEAANSVWLNKGDGTFEDTGQRLGEAITDDVALGDLDGDGDLDVVAGGWDEAARIWMNDGNGTFTENEGELTSKYLHIHGLDIGDLDGDTDLDAFMAIAGDINQVWLNDGVGAFSLTEQDIPSSADNMVFLGDLDGDDDLDAFVTNALAADQIWLNDGAGNFADSGLRLGNEYSIGIELGDLDGDGDLDAFVTHGLLSRSSGGGMPNTVWLNMTPPATTSAPPPQLSGNDRGRIAFYSERHGKAEIYSMNVDGSDLQRLTSNSAEDMGPAFSYDGSKIAFTSDRSGNQEIYVMNSDGSDPRRLTDTPEREIHPEWSPDGKYIAFARYGCAGWDCGEIFVMNADGSNVRQLTDNAANDMRPVWSPDSTKILFNSNRDGNHEIYSMNPDGTDQRKLTDTPKADMFPRVSPDGTKVVYAQFDFQARTSEVHVMNVDGTDDTMLANVGRVNEDPVWSPDGSQIVFQSDRDGNFEIYVMNADGSDQQRLTHHQAGDYWPTWGPSSVEAPPLVNVPQGKAPTIDGTMSPGEWDEAVSQFFADRSELLLLYADGYLYLGIRANTPGMIAGNVFVNRGEEIAILHSSAALGTAIYQQGEGRWYQVQDFTWQCRSTSSSESAQAERDAFLQQEGWVAANSRMGTPEELEYRIEMPEDALRVAVNFIRASNTNQKIPWPAGLEDSCITPTPGGLPADLYFLPEEWTVLEISR